MESAFRKISRVGNLSGATKWYLSHDCLLAAKRFLYVVEYKRFYLRDIESIVVWPRRASVLRRLIPGAFFVALAGLFWFTWSVTATVIWGSIGLSWAALEVALGPTANSRIRTTGATVDLPLVKRARSARKVLAKIDAAIQTDRGGLIGQPTAPVLVAQLGERTLSAGSDAADATSTLGTAT